MSRMKKEHALGLIGHKRRERKSKNRRERVANVDVTAQITFSELRLPRDYIATRWIRILIVD